jgi:hypothetical protein
LPILAMKICPQICLPRDQSGCSNFYDSSGFLVVMAFWPFQLSAVPEMNRRICEGISLVVPTFPIGPAFYLFWLSGHSSFRLSQLSGHSGVFSGLSSPWNRRNEKRRFALNKFTTCCLLAKKSPGNCVGLSENGNKICTGKLVKMKITLNRHAPRLTPNDFHIPCSHCCLLLSTVPLKLSAAVHV